MIKDFTTKERRLKRNYPISPELNNVINIRDILNFIFAGLLIFLAVDLVAYMTWIFSGQTPVDNFYLGGVTNWIISLIK